MSSDESAKVTLQNSAGGTKEVQVRSSGKVSCPECGSENIDIHNLTRVLAGECAACFTTWTIGVDNDWEVVGDE